MIASLLSRFSFFGIVVLATIIAATPAMADDSTPTTPTTQDSQSQRGLGQLQPTGLTELDNSRKVSSLYHAMNGVGTSPGYSPNEKLGPPPQTAAQELGDGCLACLPKLAYGLGQLPPMGLTEPDNSLEEVIRFRRHAVEGVGAGPSYPSPPK